MAGRSKLQVVEFFFLFSLMSLAMMTVGAPETNFFSNLELLIAQQTKMSYSSTFFKLVNETVFAW